jgi:GTP cyclohydrolase I
VNIHLLEHSFAELIRNSGDYHLREGLQETPARAAKAFMDMMSGYQSQACDVAKVFEDGAENSNDNEMVIVSDIPLYSLCEHHMLPIFGYIHVGYIPNGKILGLSKFKRVADIFAKRLQVQERLTAQVADAIDENLLPKGCAVLVEARHMCMEMRGVKTTGSVTRTTAIRGVFNEHKVRAEFLSLVTTPPRW